MPPQNGYVPANALVQVESGQWMQLETATAAAYLAAKRERPILNIAKPAGAYRTFAVQQDMHVHPGLYNLNPNSTAGLAAPGHSNHGLGICVDIIGDLSWFLANGARFGFYRPLPGDPNHFIFNAPTWASAVVLTGTQRRVIATLPVNRRSGPGTNFPQNGDALPPNTVGNFIGFAHGNPKDGQPAGNDVWYKGVSSDWFWAGGFTETSGHDLPDLSAQFVPPPVVVPGHRTVLASATANVRGAASTSAPVLAVYPAGSDQAFAYFAHGSAVNGIDLWYVTADKASFSWAGGYTSQSTDGLAELPATTDPGSVLDESYKTFTADSPLAVWVGSPNYGKRPAAKKDHITLHWMAGTLSGTDQTFQQIVQPITNGHSMGTASTYGVGPGAIHQYIKETEYQHGDGDAGSNASGISIEHEGGYTLPDGTLAPVTQPTLDLSAKLCADVAKRLGLGKLELGVNVFPHNHWVATTCPGTLDMAYIVDHANAINGEVDVPPVVTPPVDPPVVTPPATKPANTLVGAIIAGAVVVIGIIAAVLANLFH